MLTFTTINLASEIDITVNLVLAFDKIVNLILDIRNQIHCLKQYERPKWLIYTNPS